MGTFHRPCCPELWHYLQPSLSSSTEREDLGLTAVFGHLTSPSLYKGMKCSSGFIYLIFLRILGGDDPTNHAVLYLCFDLFLLAVIFAYYCYYHAP